MPTTPHGLPYPSPTADPNVPYDLEQLATALDPFAGDTGWLPMTLNPDLDPVWEAKSGQPMARRIGRIVYCAGLIGPTVGSIPAGTNSVIAYMPPGIGGPAQSEWFSLGTNTSQPPCTAVVLASGGIQLRSPGVTVSYVGLGTINYVEG